jgi:hypothetical protein
MLSVIACVEQNRPKEQEAAQGCGRSMFKKLTAKSPMDYVQISHLRVTSILERREQVGEP